MQFYACQFKATAINSHLLNASLSIKYFTRTKLTSATLRSSISQWKSWLIRSTTPQKKFTACQASTSFFRAFRSKVVKSEFFLLISAFTSCRSCNCHSWLVHKLRIELESHEHLHHRFELLKHSGIFTTHISVMQHIASLYATLDACSIHSCFAEKCNFNIFGRLSSLNPSNHSITIIFELV